MKCQNCGNKVARFPIKDSNGKIIWKNLFKIDIVTLLFMISILLLIYGYNQSITDCREVMEQPCEFCARSNCCYYIENGVFNESKYQPTVIQPEPQEQPNFFINITT